MANFLSNGGLELIMGTAMLVYFMLREHIEEKKNTSARIIKN